MKDSFGRTIDYLRISVIGRCQLRCLYCVRRQDAAPNGSGEADDATSDDGYLYTRLRNPGRYAMWVKREGYLPAVVEVQVDDPTAALERTVVLEPKEG